MTQALSEAKLRSWMQRIGPGLIALSSGICRDRHRAEEIVQEAFVKLWRKPPDAGEVAYLSWMRRVVTNLSINALQRTKRPSALPEFSTDPAMRAPDRRDERRDLREQVDRVRAAMDRLDDSKRAILMLRAHEQLSYDQIAEHLGIPIGTVMSRLNRARTALLEEMKKDLNHPENEPLVFEFSKYRQA
jgi:RNA polymerase sigma-70 factor (ECF subfamily)